MERMSRVRELAVVARSYGAKLKTPERGGFELEFLHEDKKGSEAPVGCYAQVVILYSICIQGDLDAGYLREMYVWEKSLLILIAGLTLFGRLDSWINLLCQSQV